MGIPNILLPLLPCGDKTLIRCYFYESQLSGQTVVPIDAASQLWQCQCANHHADDYFRHNYAPALSDMVKILNNYRSICGWNMLLFMNSRANPHKAFEDACRNKRANSTQEDVLDNTNNLRGNTPAYIARAVNVCKFMDIRVVVSAMMKQMDKWWITLFHQD